MEVRVLANSGVLARPSTPRVSADPEALLTVKHVAELLQVPVSWVYEHTRPDCRNPLPCIKLGKYLRFVVADIREYLTSARSASLGRRR